MTDDILYASVLHQQNNFFTWCPILQAKLVGKDVQKLNQSYFKAASAVS